MSTPNPSSSSTPNPLRIAILDDYLSLAPPHFSSNPNLHPVLIPSTIPSYTPPSALTTQATRLAPYTVISSMRERTPFPASLLAQLPNLRLLLTTGPQNRSIDLEAASAQGVVVTGTRGARRGEGGEDPEGERLERAFERGFDATTQHAWALVLSLAGRLGEDARGLREGAWQAGTSVLLAGRRFGAVGLGRLGARAARTAVLGFGMEVVAWSENLTQTNADETAKSYGLPEGSILVVSKKEVFEADVVSLHYVLSDRSRNLVGEQELGWMHKGAMLINTSRAGLVDEQALLSVLRAGKIRGAGLDVFWEEPLPEDSVWRKEKWGEEGRSMIVLSPHMGYVEEVVMNRWYEAQAEEVERWQRGEEPRFKLN